MAGDSGRWRMGKQRSADDVRGILREFGSSGLTRREFCQRHGIPLTTLDYWRRRHSRQPRLVEVEVAPCESAGQFTLALANGRRIESSWVFAEGQLARLIFLAESAERSVWGWGARSTSRGE